MSIIVNGTTLTDVLCEGVDLDKIVCDGVTVFESGYVISWDEPIATANCSGTTPDSLTGYMGETTATKATSAGRGAEGAYYGNRRIRYIKPDGTTGYANPFEAGSITIKIGTTIYFEMFAGSMASTGRNGSNIVISYNNLSDNSVYGGEGNLISCEVKRNITRNMKIKLTTEKGSASSFLFGSLIWQVKVTG